MTIDDFCLILEDTFRIDTNMPPLFGVWRAFFKQESYRRWSVDEIIQYVINNIYPRSECSIDELLVIVASFRNKSSIYSQHDENARTMFRCAVETANEVIDLLLAMV